MNRVIQSLIKVEKSIQIIAVIGATMFVGYVLFTSFQSNQNESVPVIPQITQ